MVPTLVFGWLYWRELVRDYDAELAAVPEDAEDAARRIVAGMRHRLDRLLEEEGERPFHQYGQIFSAVDAMGDEVSILPSPLVNGPRPQGILGWFSFDLGETATEVDFFFGAGRQKSDELLQSLTLTLSDFRDRKAKEGLLERLSQLEGSASPFPLSAVSVHRSFKSELLSCVVECSPHMVGRTLPVFTSELHSQFFRRADGTPVAIVSRRILAKPNKGDLPPEADCLRPLLEDGFTTQQGIVVDVDWLLRRLPFEVAAQTLGESQELISLNPAQPIKEAPTVFAHILPVVAMGFEVEAPGDEDFGRLDVAINTDNIRLRFEKQSKRFMGVALMMVLTMAAGMALLYRSVNRELEQAHRMQNFVAAVTHELRTPLSTIRLHGEMLLEGWASDPKVQREYYSRIVRETNRLSTLVENVLQKSRLKESVVEAQPGDLNRVIEALKPNLQAPEGGSADLSFELEAGPRALITSEAVSGILSNLVENARKYAPVSPGGEPIQIRTREEGETVLLEVADRGPGVPAEERERIFDAFYRIGSEATRTTTGTGLGLHLVALHAESVGARASVENRSGGGSVFRIAFLKAV